MTTLPFSPSSAEVGSSAKMSFGFLASARAMATRCFSPPDMRSGRLREAVAEIDVIEGGFGERLCESDFLLPHELQDDLHLLAGGERGEQVEALEDEAAIGEAEAVDLAARQEPEVGVERDDAAGVGLHQAGDGGEERRLARAGGAHDEDDLAGLDQEVDALEHVDHDLAGLEALLDATGLDGPALAGLFRARRRRARVLDNLELLSCGAGSSFEQVRRFALLEGAKGERARPDGDEQEEDAGLDQRADLEAHREVGGLGEEAAMPTIRRPAGRDAEDADPE
jgi:hypothetical protein